MKKIIEKIIGLWNIYGGVILSLFIAWKNDFTRASMDNWTSYLVLLLTCISLLTFFKVTIFKKKGNKIDSIALSQQSIKASNTAINPLKTGEELGNTIIYTVKGTKKFMKKLKDFFKVLWGNKFTLSNTILTLFVATSAQIATYTKNLYNISWFANHEIFIKIASPIITAIYIFVVLYTAYTKYGFEGLQELADKKLSQLSKEKKKEIKNKISALEKVLSETKAKYKKYIDIIENAKTLISANIQLVGDDLAKFNEANNSINSVRNTITSIENSIKELKEKL